MSIEQNVYCKRVGQGEALVLLHGWGVNSAVWEPVIENLSQHFTLYLIDLPGFGNSAPLSNYSLQSMSEAILDAVPETAIWCGWSLGGLIATFTAITYPNRVTKLIQVSSSVKFVANDTWPGVQPEVFDNFLLGLQKNATKTLSRFIALQAMGCESARADSNYLKKILSGTNSADGEALIAGLKLLSESDLRDSFPTLKQPCLSLFGQFDSLLPLQAQQEITALLPSVQSQVFKQSSHPIFVSETDLFCQSITNFIVD